jgi:hypothetical protein
MKQRTRGMTLAFIILAVVWGLYIGVGRYIASYLGRRDFERKRRELRKDKLERGECRYPNLPSSFCVSICNACRQDQRETAQ